MYCSNCGESCKDTAKFCPNCGAALSLPPGYKPTKRPTVPFALSILAVLGMLVVALTMSFIDDAPGDIGSQIEGIFHAVGTVQLLLALGVLVSACFIMIRGFDVRLWGTAILGLGVISVASLLFVVLQGTFAVIFLALPGALAAVAGFLARQGARRR